MDRYDAYRHLRFEYTEKVLTATANSGAKRNAIIDEMHQDAGRRAVPRPSALRPRCA
jgi:hypothetical protein